MAPSRSLAAPAAAGAITALALGAPYMRSTFNKLQAWTPSAEEMWADLSYSPPKESDVAPLTSWQGAPFFERGASTEQEIGARQLAGIEFFDGYGWTRWTSFHWPIALTAVAIYLVSIPLMRRLVARRGKFDIQRASMLWNAALSAFSWVGLSACLPVLGGALRQNGLHFTTCAPAIWYGQGWHGLWVAVFCYSKIFELVDTAMLLLAGRPVVLLQWWHHATVLLYCWHSYSARIATGMWFATMNYAVHSIMYGYFAATQHSKRARALVRPFAIYITLAQLAQMVVGIAVTVRAMVVQANGGECHVNKTNSILGLFMYWSYFMLFLKLFVENYVLKGAPKPAKAAPPVVEAPAKVAQISK